VLPILGGYFVLKQQVHDEYGKQVLGIAAGSAYSQYGPSVVIDFDGSKAQIDGTVSSIVAVEIESRTGKQIRGAVLDLVLHKYPKKLLILIPKYIGRNQVAECQFILRRFLDTKDFRVVLLDGTGHDPAHETDAEKVRASLLDLGCPLLTKRATG